MAALRAPPLRCVYDIIAPLRPIGFAEIAVAVAAAIQVDEKHAEPAVREGARLQRHHAPRLVHLFGERVDEEERTLSGPSRRITHAKTPSAPQWQVERFR